MRKKVTLVSFLFYVSLSLFSQNNLTLLHKTNNRDIAECATDAIYSQPATSPWGYTASAEEYNVEVFSYFHNVTEDIGGIRFWGSIVDIETFEQIDPPLDFIIRFYDGPSTEVGNLIETYTLLLDGTLLEMNGLYKVWTFDAVFPTTINMSSGWVSIQNTDPVYSFLWRDTKDAPGEISMYVNHNDGIYHSTVYPMGFCLNSYNPASNDEYSFVNLTIFPNPANNVISIKVDYTIQSVEIFDNIGKMKQSILVSENECKLNVSKFENGFYFVRILFENNDIITKKILLQ